MNKPNRPPAGVLGVGFDDFLLSPMPETSWLGRASGFLLGACRDVAARCRQALGDTTLSRMPMNMLRSLRQRHDWCGAWYRRVIHLCLYVARSSGMPIRHGRYLHFVYADSGMRAYVRRDPRVLERHLHRYVNAAWSGRRRLKNLHQHYRFALAYLPSGLFEAVYAHGRACLGSLIAKDGATLTLSLRAPIFMGCEGELCLQLENGNGEPLYSIVFSVMGERPAIVIGCLQGPRGENGKDAVRALTRNLHGMRPKHLMLSLIHAFARHYGIHDILAVSNAAHPLRRTGRPVHADYDAFWVEQQGRKVAGGWYALPSSPNHKTEAEVPSHHRSAFRRREALRIQAETLLAQALGYPVAMPVVPKTVPRLVTHRPLHNFRPETSWVS